MIVSRDDRYEEKNGRLELTEEGEKIVDELITAINRMGNIEATFCEDSAEWADLRHRALYDRLDNAFRCTTASNYSCCELLMPYERQAYVIFNLEEFFWFVNKTKEEAKPLENVNYKEMRQLKGRVKFFEQYRKDKEEEIADMKSKFDSELCEYRASMGVYKENEKKLLYALIKKFGESGELTLTIPTFEEVKDIEFEAEKEADADEKFLYDEGYEVILRIKNKKE